METNKMTKIVEWVTRVMMALTGNKYEKPLPGLLEHDNGEAARRLGW